MGKEGGTAMAMSRRGFLIGGAAVVGVAAVGVVGGGVLVEDGVLPGKSKLDEALGRCGTALEPLPELVLDVGLDGRVGCERRCGGSPAPAMLVTP